MMIRAFVILQTFLATWILSIRLCYKQPLTPNSDMSKEQPPMEAVALSRWLIGCFHRQLQLNTFLQGESALKEVQPVSISASIPYGEAKTGCPVKFTCQADYSPGIRVTTERHISNCTKWSFWCFKMESLSCLSLNPSCLSPDVSKLFILFPTYLKSL